MDSLLASYASSDDDENRQSASSPHRPPVKSSSLFSSLPAPKLERPSGNPTAGNTSRLPKRVVQFKPPIALKRLDSDEEDEVEQEKEKKRRREPEFSSQASSFLRSIPPPKHSASVLGSGALGAGGSSGRKSIIQNEVEALGPSDSAGGGQYGDATPCVPQQQPEFNRSSGDGVVDYASYPSYEAGTTDASHGYVYHDQFAISGKDDWKSPFPDTAGSLGPLAPKMRGKKAVPTEIVEIKQDDLTKDRPRADQTKLTGIAFGPGYQPQSSKGKPSKLHKRKHQIGSLFFDMKQKESELAERRARGFLTKAQTQGKYGW